MGKHYKRLKSNKKYVDLNFILNPTPMLAEFIEFMDFFKNKRIFYFYSLSGQFLRFENHILSFSALCTLNIEMRRQNIDKVFLLYLKQVLILKPPP